MKIYPCGLSDNDIEEVIRDPLLMCMFDSFVFYDLYIKRKMSKENSRKCYFLMKYAADLMRGIKKPDHVD